MSNSSGAIRRVSNLWVLKLCKKLKKRPQVQSRFSKRNMHASPFCELLGIIRSIRRYQSIKRESTSEVDLDDTPVSCYKSNLMVLLQLPSPPRLSGYFKLKTSTAMSRIRAWKERWLVMTQGDNKTTIHIYRVRKECHPAEHFIVCPLHCVDAEPSLNEPGSFCFSFLTVGGRRIVLAATSEFQMWCWISCIRLLSDD